MAQAQVRLNRIFESLKRSKSPFYGVSKLVTRPIKAVTRPLMNDFLKYLGFSPSVSNFKTFSSKTERNVSSATDRRKTVIYNNTTVASSENKGLKTTLQNINKGLARNRRILVKISRSINDLLKIFKKQSILGRLDKKDEKEDDKEKKKTLTDRIKGFGKFLSGLLPRLLPFILSSMVKIIGAALAALASGKLLAKIIEIRNKINKKTKERKAEKKRKAKRVEEERFRRAERSREVSRGISEREESQRRADTRRRNAARRADDDLEISRREGRSRSAEKIADFDQKMLDKEGQVKRNQNLRTIASDIADRGRKSGNRFKKTATEVVRRAPAVAVSAPVAAIDLLMSSTPAGDTPEKRLNFLENIFKDKNFDSNLDYSSFEKFMDESLVEFRGNELSKILNKLLYKFQDNKKLSSLIQKYIDDNQIKPTFKILQELRKMVKFVEKGSGRSRMLKMSLKEKRPESEKLEDKVTKENFREEIQKLRNEIGMNKDDFIKLQPRKQGGPVSALTPYVVGERGRELFVPKVDGTVVNNNVTERIIGSSSDSQKLSAVSGSKSPSAVVYNDNRVTNNVMGGGGGQQAASGSSSSKYSPFNSLASRLSTRADRTLAPAGYTARTLA